MTASATRWQDYALCAQTDPDMFFPDVDGVHRTAEKAKEICAECPVKAQCAALGMNFEYGVFGGLSPADRRRIRKGTIRRHQGKKEQTLELARIGMPADRIASTLGLSKRQVQRTIAQSRDVA